MAQAPRQDTRGAVRRIITATPTSLFAAGAAAVVLTGEGATSNPTALAAWLVLLAVIVAMDLASGGLWLARRRHD